MPSNFLGRLQTFLFGAAIGRAASDSVTPVLEPVRQHAWEKNQNKVLDPNTAAEALAQGIITEVEGQDDASRSGVSVNRYGVLWRLAQKVPGVGEARTLRRRAKANGDRAITLNQLHHVYAKLQIEPQYWDALDVLVQDILSPGEIAAAIHRGLIPDPGGLLKGQQPEPPFKVDSYPVYPIDALQEAEGHGFDKERLGVLVGLQGLPMGPHEAAQAVFRKIITFGDYIRAFNESNNRNEWAQAIYEQSKQIPTARDFFENALRGYHKLDWAQKQAERHGMSPEDSLVIYQNQGRPMNVRQITQALARGGVFKPEPGELTDPYDASIVEGNLKPAYYDLAKANRYSYTVPFWWRTLLTSGAIKAPEAEQLLLNLGNPPDLAKRITDHFAAATATAPTDSRVNLATSQVIAALKRRFILELTDEQGVTNGLQTVGVSATSADRILELWTWERLWTVKVLTPTQIKKEYSGGTITLDDAIAELVKQHYSVDDATRFLQS